VNGINKALSETHPNFIYLSAILNLPVCDLVTGRRIGKVVDLAAVLKDVYPVVTDLIVKQKGKKGLYRITWSNIKNLGSGKFLTIDTKSLIPENGVDTESRILLRESFLDQQIVDISGAKVVRVNDLHLLQEQSNLWLVHMDVGFKGLLRRLGFLGPYNSLVKWLFSYELKDLLISWKYIQPITSVKMSKAVQLKVNHAKLSELHPADLSDILVDLGVDEREIVFNSLEEPLAADTLEELPMKIRTQVAESLSHEKLARILDEMPVDEAVDLLASLSPRLVNSIYNILPAEKVGQMKQLLRHSENRAGSIMNPAFIVTKEDSLSSEIINQLRNEAEETESLHYIYVVNNSDALVGVISLRQLLTADPNEPVSTFMKRKIMYVMADTDIRDVAQVFSKYNFALLPVVDENDRILGIITMRDAFEAVFSKIRDMG
jgi:magnesium transporter